MEFKETTKKKVYLYNGKILSLKRDEVILPDGTESIREIVEHKGGASVLCVYKGKVLLVKQFRYAYMEEVYEIPAGLIDEGETPDKAAIRELEEEGGIKAEKVIKLFDIYPSPGYTNEIIRVFRAKKLKKSSQKLDDGEFLTAKWYKKRQVKKMLKEGLIKDAKTLLALKTIL